MVEVVVVEKVEGMEAEVGQAMDLDPGMEAGLDMEVAVVEGEEVVAEVVEMVLAKVQAMEVGLAMVQGMGVVEMIITHHKLNKDLGIHSIFYHL